MAGGLGRWSPRRMAMLAGAGGFVLGAAYLIAAILRSPSSTAGIGFLFVPFYALIPAAVAALLGGAGAFVWQWWQAPARRFSASVLVSVLVVVAIVGTLAPFFFVNMRLTAEVAHISRMDAAELVEYFEVGALRRDKFVLGAIVQNRSVDTDLLDRVAHLEDPMLHRRLGSIFPVLGENRRGLAVMRLIARHDRTGPDTLRWLSQSPDDYVLSDVAGNDQTPVEVLLRLDEKGGYLIEWGLARNPKTPTEILERLATRANEYTRSSVARNPSTPGKALGTLADDPVWHVRRDLAMNETVSTELLERLSKDADEQVRRTATHRLERR